MKIPPALGSLPVVLLLLAHAPETAGSDPAFEADRIARAIVYPVDAVLRGVQGRVLMRVLLNADGSAARIDWQQGNDTLLASAAVRALTRYEFSAPGREADPVNGWIYIPIHFSLEASAPERDSAGRSVINVVPSFRHAEQAPRLNAFHLREYDETRGRDTVAPQVSPAQLREHFYYPDMARFQRIEGTVLVHTLVDRKGKVVAAYALLSDNAILDEAAVETVSRSTFSPGTIQGRPAPVWTVVPVRFQLKLQSP